MSRLVTSWVVDEDGLAQILAPRNDVVGEADPVDGVYGLGDGPFLNYERRVEVESVDGGHQVTETYDYALSVAYVGWLFAWPVRRSLAERRPDGAPPPWWSPPDRLDTRAATVLGLLCAVAWISGYLGTLLTQTLTFAADEFDVSTSGQANVLSIVRVSIALSLVLVAAADRRGRRLVLTGSAFAGIIFAALGALSPSIVWLTAFQTVSRGCATAMLILVGVVAAEEVPKGSRAYAVSVLGLTAAFGSGNAVTALAIADLGEKAWRFIYVVPLIALPVALNLARRLPESKRFVRMNAAVRMVGHRKRLLLLASTALMLAIFTTPASTLQNEFLREERGFSAPSISAFTLLTGTPGGIGVAIGGRLADRRGRKVVGAFAVFFGVAAGSLQFVSHGWSIWLWATLGSIIGAAALPALGVYGPELFPTALRGKANGLISLAGFTGSVIGLTLASRIGERLDDLGLGIASMAVFPLFVVLSVLFLYPETAGTELETLNPEDEPPPEHVPL